MIKQKMVPLLFVALAVALLIAGCSKKEKPSQQASNKNAPSQETNQAASTSSIDRPEAEALEKKSTPKGAVIPKEFHGTWIETGDEGKEFARMYVTEQAIDWTAPGSSTQTISATSLTISKDQKTFSFTSEVIIAEGAFIPAPAIVGKPNVVITRDGNYLVVKIGKVKLKSKARGLFKWKAGTSISFEVIDGKEVQVITRPEEVHRYHISKSQ